MLPGRAASRERTTDQEDDQRGRRADRNRGQRLQAAPAR